MTSSRLACLNAPRAPLWAGIAVPLAFGLLSLWLGADRNFDLLNYHLYDAYALLHGRLGIDLAPAGVQSYFNPLADLPYYLMALHWPAWLTGFAMGVLHGLNFVLLMLIASVALPGVSSAQSRRLPILLALAGCLTANFLSEVGNSMNDNSTALLVLAGLCLVFRRGPELQTRTPRSAALLLLAGLLVGAAAGLKLTNAVYALSFAMAFLVLPLPWSQRLRLAILFSIGAFLGLCLAGGYWYGQMWQHFHNPLFPQFGSIFPNPLARPIAAADAHWLPKNVLQVVLWPFIIAWDSQRVGQIALRQIIWPVLYVLFLAWGVQRLRRRSTATLDSRQLYLLTVIGIGFLLWMLLFSIYRYLVPIELLAPLAVYILCRHLFPLRGGRIAAWTLGLCTAVVLLGGCRTWGHESRAEPMFSAELPALHSPAATTILLVGTDKPYAWLAPLFPDGVSFVGAHQNFPEARQYRERVHAMAAVGKETYAIVEAHFIWRLDSVARANAIASGLNLTSDPRGCRFLRSIATGFHLHATLQDEGNACRFALAPEDREDTAAEDRASASRAASALAAYGLKLDAAGCRVYMAKVGEGSYPYQWCPVAVMPLAGKGPA